MKPTDFAITAHGEGRLGPYHVDPARLGGVQGGRPTSFRLLRMIGEWFDRPRQRRALEQLDDRMLRDIGLTRFDVQHEIEKPFWKS